MNNKPNKNNKNLIISKLKNNGLDININKLIDKNNKENKDNNDINPNNNNISSDSEQNNDNENKKGEIIEQNIDRILNQNKTLYLQNLINQKKKKEKQLKNKNNKNLLLKYYLYKWKNDDDSNNNNLNKINKNNNYNKDNNYNYKKVFKNYDMNNQNDEKKKFNDKYYKNTPYKNLNDTYRKLFLKKPFNIIKQNYYYKDNKNKKKDDSNEIPDLSYIRNKLHVSIVKRIKMTEDEIKKYKNAINTISSVVKKHIYKYFINQYREKI